MNNKDYNPLNRLKRIPYRQKQFRRASIAINRIFLIALVGLILGSFLDLQISKLLTSRPNIVAHFFRFFGEMPMIIILASFAIEILKRRILLLKDGAGYKFDSVDILAVIAIILPAFISSKGIPKYFDITNIHITLSIFFFYILISSAISYFYKDIEDEELKKSFLFLSIIVILTMIFMNSLKRIWSRARYFPMLEKNDFKEFSFWLIPRFKSQITDAFKSFPSGHTTSAAVTLSLLFLKKNPRQALIGPFLRIFAIAWPLLVAFSRILDGAHYLTDVSFALIMTILIIKFSYNIVLKRKKG